MGPYRDSVDAAETGQIDVERGLATGCCLVLDLENDVLKPLVRDV
jgi:hypothetical protein